MGPAAGGGLGTSSLGLPTPSLSPPLPLPCILSHLWPGDWGAQGHSELFSEDCPASDLSPSSLQEPSRDSTEDPRLVSWGFSYICCGPGVPRSWSGSHCRGLLSARAPPKGPLSCPRAPSEGLTVLQHPDLRGREMGGPCGPPRRRDGPLEGDTPHCSPPS